MRLFGAAAALAALSLAENTAQAGPRVQSLAEEQNPWAYADFAIGVANGSYDTLQMYSYDSSCFSTLFSFAYGNIYNNQFFIEGIDDSHIYREVRHWIDVALIAYDFFGVVQTCMDAQEFARETGWYRQYEFMAMQGAKQTDNKAKRARKVTKSLKPLAQKMVQPVVGQADASDIYVDIAYDVWALFLYFGEYLLIENVPYYSEGMDALTLASNLYSVYETFVGSAFYFFEDGRALGGAIVDSAFILDRYLGFLGLESRPQWARFDAELHEIWDQEQAWIEENCPEDSEEICHVEWMELGGTATEFAMWVEDQEEMEDLAEEGALEEEEDEEVDPEELDQEFLDELEALDQDMQEIIDMLQEDAPAEEQ